MNQMDFHPSRVLALLQAAERAGYRVKWEASETRSEPADLIDRRPYDPAVAGEIASDNGRRRFVRAVANASSLAVRTTTICS